MTASTRSRTVVFITGAWMHVSSWDKFRGAFEAAGYTTHAPAWPYLDGEPRTLRANPDKRLGRLTFGAIVDRYQAFIEALPEKPILVGHSMGGLIAQLLLDRGVGIAGVAMDPGPPAGVFPGLVSLLAALPPVLKGPGTPHLLTREGFARNFANTLTPAEQEAAYDAYVVPTSSRIFYQAAAMIGTRVHPGRRTQPLLVLSAEHDRTVSPFLARQVYRLQKKAPSRTDFHEFQDRSHFLAGERGWEDVARYVLDWLAEAA